MKKKILLVLSILLSLSILSGCAQAVTTASAPAAAATSSAVTTTEIKPTGEAATQTITEATDSGFPVTITDHLGRTVEITSEPLRLVSGYYITSSLLIALGLEDKIVGLEAKADNRPIYKLSAPGLLDLPNVGSAKDFNLEAALALKPDLVILPVKLKDVVMTLAEMGITTLAVNPESKDELQQTIEMVGEATGTSERAKNLLAKSQELSDKAAAFGQGEAGQKIYLAGNSAFLSTAGSKMYQSSLITNVGAENAAADLTDNSWATISYEQLLQWQPDLIVVVPEAVYSVDEVLADQSLSALKAVQEKKVYQMPQQFEAWDSPVPSGVLGQLYLASTLYPSKYSSAEFAEDVAEFYREFYGFEAVLSQ